MIKNPLVSVIISTYRRTSELDRALKSLVGQTYQPFEVILVDDNGDDSYSAKVEAIAESYQSLLPLTYVKNPNNLGSSASRNRGIELCQGDYITFLDDDDVYLSEKISRQLADMQQKKADYGLTDLYLYNENDQLIDKRKRTYIQSYDQESLLRYHLLHHLTGTDTLMFRRDYLLKIGCFPLIDSGDEFYLMLEAIKSGGRFAYLADCQVKAYIHSGEDAGLSSGQQKIKGTQALFEVKKSYFSQLKAKDVRYIKVRYHAVLAFAQYRRGKKLLAIWEMTRAFMISPLACFHLFQQHK